MKYLIAIILLASTAIAQNNSGTLVIAPIRPQASNDTFPSAIANEIKGGPFSVGTTAAMSNIPSERLVSGSTAYITNDSTLRLWNGSNWSSDNLRSAIGLAAGQTASESLRTGEINGSGTDMFISDSSGGLYDHANDEVALTAVDNDFQFTSTLRRDSFRAALGLGATWLTNTNVTNFRTDIGLGTGNDVTFNVGTFNGPVTFNEDVYGSYFEAVSGGTNGVTLQNTGMFFFGTAAATTRTNLGLGLPVLTNTNNANFLSALGIGTNSSPTFSNATVSNLLVTGNFTNQGTIYGFKTNVGPFEGIGNFFASNNTTVSNETLFRVGLAEQNNRSAQFGFRVARTNNGGEGFAVFSVYGYNALMMIGPSDRSRSNSLTNTNAAIEADIWSISPTDKVMTLITTNTGAMQMHRPIGFNTNASTPANTTNVAGWIEFYVGTNSVRVPYYQ